MGEANQYRHSSTKKVGTNISRRVPSSDLCSYQVSCVLILWLLSYVIQEEEEEEEHHGQNAKTTFGHKK